MKNPLDALDPIDRVTNPWLKMLTAPLMGALFLMFMPAIGFILVGQALYKKITG